MYTLGNKEKKSGSQMYEETDNTVSKAGKPGDPELVRLTGARPRQSREAIINDVVFA